MTRGVKLTDPEVHSRCNVLELEWIGGEYKGAKSNIKVRCKNKHTFEKRFENIRIECMYLCVLYVCV